MNRDVKWGPWPDCVICGDSGLHDKTGEWEFCRCKAGLKYQAEHPEAAKLANEKLAKLEGICK